MQSPLILVIDDSVTARKMVEFHLSQAGYRIATASDADRGLELARSIKPGLILLDHQLLGTTGDDVCRRLLADEATAQIPVVISSAMRNRAFASYTELPNVVDQIPKPFTPELLKSGVANALQTGAMVINAQRTGSAMPESVEEVHQSALEGDTRLFPLPAILGFLNGIQQEGRLVVESGQQRFRFILSGGRIQAVIAPGFSAERLAEFLPAEMADLAPLLAITLREQQDSQTSGLIKMLERSLTDPRRPRALLRLQAAALTYAALKSEPGRFTFEPHAALPPMFQAFPLQSSLTALAIEGVRRCERPADAATWGPLYFARSAQRGGSSDRSGLSPTELKIHTLLDGALDLAAVAQQVNVELPEVAAVARGLELAGLVERRAPSLSTSILALEDDPPTVQAIQGVFGPAGLGFQLKIVRDRVAAQLLLRRSKFDLVLMALDRPEQEVSYRLARGQAPATTRFVGIVQVQDPATLARLEALGLDGLLQRPPTEEDLLATFTHLVESGAPVPAPAASAPARAPEPSPAPAAPPHPRGITNPAPQPATRRPDEQGSSGSGVTPLGSNLRTGAFDTD